MNIMDKYRTHENHMKNVIDSLPQAPFCQIINEKNMKTMDKDRKHENHIKHVIYSLPQAPFWQIINEKI